ncbi:MAG: cytochrome B6, partial [Aquificaceae bacterium]
RERRPILRKKVMGGRVLIIEAPYVKSIEDLVDAFIKGEKRGEEPIIITTGKASYAFATVILAIPIFLFYPLTTHRMSFYPPDKSALVLNFKYRSSPAKEVLREGAGLKHMQAQRAIVKERSPVKVEVFLENRLIYSKVFNPRGLRKDAAIFVYDELFFKPEGQGLRIRMEETAHKEKVKELEFKALERSKDSVLIIYDEAKGNFVVLR